MKRKCHSDDNNNVDDDDDIGKRKTIWIDSI